MAKKTNTKAPVRVPRIKYTDSGDKLTAAKIRPVDDVLEFPEDYKRLLQKTNGGVPDHPFFTWKHPSEGTQEAEIDRFFGIGHEPMTTPFRKVDCVSAIMVYRDVLPQQSIPIGIADQEDLLLTFSHGRRKGQVWIKRWEHGLADPETELYRVAKSFSEFLSKLSKDEPE